MAAGFEREYDCFGKEESYFLQLPTLLHHKRLRLAKCLQSVGLQPILPQGGYFMITDISTLSEPLSSALEPACTKQRDETDEMYSLSGPFVILHIP